MFISSRIRGKNCNVGRRCPACRNILPYFFAGTRFYGEGGERTHVLLALLVKVPPDEHAPDDVAQVGVDVGDAELLPRGGLLAAVQHAVQGVLGGLEARVLRMRRREYIIFTIITGLAYSFFKKIPTSYNV